MTPAAAAPLQPSAPAKSRRRSKSLPIAVAAGLAIGVFAGLLLVRDPGAAEAEDGEEVAEVEVDSTGPDGEDGSETGAEGGSGGDDEDEGGGEGASQEGEGAEGAEDGDTVASAEDGDAEDEDDEDGEEEEDAAGIDAGVETAAAEPDAGEPEKVLTTAFITFKVKPERAAEAEDYSLTVDGVPVIGPKLPVQLEDGKKRIKVVAKADGYRSIYRRYVIRGDREIVLRFRKPRPKGGPGGPGGPGGLIDL